MPLKLNLTISNKTIYLLIGLAVLFGLLIGVYAYTVAPGAIPDPGHALAKIQGYFQGDASLDVSLGKLQQRVSGTCAVGNSIRAIDGTGAVTCEADDVSGGVSRTSEFCNSIDTFDYTFNTGYAWKGCGSISMLINGRNICEDSDGCTYRIWRYTAARPAGSNFYTSNPIAFRQILNQGSHDWHDAVGNQTGKNGDGVEKKMIDWESFIMNDDLISPPDECQGDYENYPDSLSWRDNSDSSAYFVVICDY